MSQKLYILHGWAYSLDPWSTTVALLQKDNIEVIQLRVPGLTEPSEDSFTIDDYVEWLHRSLPTDKNFTLLAHSNGGRIAMHYLRKYPDTIAQLILLDSAGIEIKSASLSTKRNIFKILAKTAKPLAKIPGLRKLVYHFLGGDYGIAPRNMRTTLTNMLASDKDFDPSFITTPTAILWGEDDEATPLAIAKILHQKIANSTLKVMPAWQHAPYRTHPDQLAIEIINILRGKK